MITRHAIRLDVKINSDVTLYLQSCQIGVDEWVSILYKESQSSREMFRRR